MSGVTGSYLAISPKRLIISSQIALRINRDIYVMWYENFAISHASAVIKRARCLNLLLYLILRAPENARSFGTGLA
jgi:hypothetical protein